MKSYHNSLMYIYSVTLPTHVSLSFELFTCVLQKRTSFLIGRESRVPGHSISENDSFLSSFPSFHCGFSEWSWFCSVMFRVYKWKCMRIVTHLQRLSKGIRMRFSRHTRQMFPEIRGRDYAINSFISGSQPFPACYSFHLKHF